MVKYIVIDSGSDASRLMFHDVKNMNNAVETSDIYELSNSILRIACKIHNSGMINRKIALPLRGVWDRYCIIEQAKKDTENKYIVVMTNVSVKKFRIDYLKDLKKYPNIYLVLVAVDSFVDKFLSPVKIMEQVKFDLVYSFDLEDCNKYGLVYSQSQYSKLDDVKASKDKLDLFFVGRAKQRLGLIQQIAEAASAKGLTCGFYILGAHPKQRKKIDGVVYIDSVMPYKDVLPMILNSKCLLDIVQDGQAGYTMRIYEALFYNKLLITNNKSVGQFDYFDNRYMKLFDRCEDIDFSFILDSANIDYQYKGEYSPVVLLEDARTRLEIC